MIAAPARGAEEDAQGVGRTPPRLSYVEGTASFWRPGSDDWVPARLNMPLAPGDALYTEERSRLEVEIGSQAFVRAGQNTQLGIEEQEPEYLRLTVSDGKLTLDARELAHGQRVEIDAPQGALLVDQSGYYRVEVDPEKTAFTTRRGGHATLRLENEEVADAASGQMLVVRADQPTRISSAAAPEPDGFDQWGDERTAELVGGGSPRELPQGVYGGADLDHYGRWRSEPTYGRVWVPSDVGADWAPYSDGQWVSDPYYGWTWVDAAPWGWAPYHYGRWVHVGGSWGWCPGPVVAAPVYSPALVAFFGGGGVSVGIGVPFVSWVALGWGEPVLPWWGPVGFVGHPHWAGWGGPHEHIDNRTYVNVTNINVYQNTHVHNAVVGVHGEDFGRKPLASARVRDLDAQRLQPVHGAVPVQPHSEGLTSTFGHARRPPEQAIQRREALVREHGAERRAPQGGAAGGGAPPAGRAPVTREGASSNPQQLREQRPTTAERRVPPERGGNAPQGSHPNGAPFAPRIAPPPHPGAAPGQRPERREAPASQPSRQPERGAPAAAPGNPPAAPERQRHTTLERQSQPPPVHSRPAAPSGTGVEGPAHNQPAPAAPPRPVHERREAPPSNVGHAPPPPPAAPPPHERMQAPAPQHVEPPRPQPPPAAAPAPAPAPRERPQPQERHRAEPPPRPQPQRHAPPPPNANQSGGGDSGRPEHKRPE